MSTVPHSEVDSLIEAFGTNKQKRALGARRMNQVGSDTLQKAVAKAAENIIDKKGVTALVNDVAQTDAQDALLYIPPCQTAANKPEDVYKFDDRILFQNKPCLVTNVLFSAVQGNTCM
ncbi:DNA-directed RNA polymerase I subunit RPA49 [Acipenser ruthenus]|uniref:DNA-directed RNA polymerase I subunit RPA49 n=1 Tax=Acipenser ruthenus TaxID=7906 RepID=A0A444UMJ9_ACIRT|nr:DNA-directed RNA polymerase I subunit RPA49 [Acipenser ruthenus]